MEDWRQRLIQPIHNPALDRIRPVRFSIKTIRSMSDEEIMAALSGEKDYGGTLYHDTLHLLSHELSRREFERSRKPHWSMAPAFWLSAIAAVASVASVVIALLQWK